MNEENKEALAAVRMIKEHCLSMDCDDCAIQFICYRYFTDGTPGDWSIGALGATERKPVVYIKPMHGGKIPEKKSAGAAAWDATQGWIRLFLMGRRIKSHSVLPCDA